jgi:hypothetical protein
MRFTWRESARPPDDPEPPDDPMDVRVDRNDVPTEVEERDAGGRLRPHAVEAAEVVDDVVRRHRPEELEIEAPGLAADRSKDVLDAAGLDAGEPAALDRGRDRADVRPLDLLPAGETLSKGEVGASGVHVARVLREDRGDEAPDEIGVRIGFRPPELAFEQIGDPLEPGADARRARTGLRHRRPP